MRSLSRITLLTALTLATLLCLGAVLTSTPAQAATEPLCGPSLLWICSGPGGPDILFGGTVCEKERFEEEHGVTCVPYGG